MLAKIILLFTLMPILELMLLLKIGEYIGVWPTIAIVIGTGVIGGILTKSQGLLILRNIRWEMSEGKMPGDELLNGLCVLVGGATLLTPGLITDVLGFFLIIPFTRGIFTKWLKRKIQSMINTGQIFLYIKR